MGDAIILLLAYSSIPKVEFVLNRTGSWSFECFLGSDMLRCRLPITPFPRLGEFLPVLLFSFLEAIFPLLSLAFDCGWSCFGICVTLIYWLLKPVDPPGVKKWNESIDWFFDYGKLWVMNWTERSFCTPSKLLWWNRTEGWSLVNRMFGSMLKRPGFSSF